SPSFPPPLSGGVTPIRSPSPARPQTTPRSPSATTAGVQPTITLATIEAAEPRVFNLKLWVAGFLFPMAFWLAALFLAIAQLPSHSPFNFTPEAPDASSFWVTVAWVLHFFSTFTAFG